MRSITRFSAGGPCDEPPGPVYDAAGEVPRGPDVVDVACNVAHPMKEPGGTDFSTRPEVVISRWPDPDQRAVDPGSPLHGY